MIVTPPETRLLDIAGPFEVIECASELLAAQEGGGSTGYTVLVASIGGGQTVLASPCRVRIPGRQNIRQSDGEIDTLLIAGCREAPGTARHDQELLRWLWGTASQVRRIGAISTGTFLLAEAGLLNGHRATTHWRWCDELSRRYPNVIVECKSTLVHDGNIYTAAGSMAGLYLALALVEEDHGPHFILRLAQELVLDFRGFGNQAQVSGVLSQRLSCRHSFREVQAWVGDHLDKSLAVRVLAGRAAMSPRNFAREFVREIGVTPARYVEQARVGAACRLLETAGSSLQDIAHRCGFRSADSMRRAFLRILNATPSEYRRRVQPPLVRDE